MHKICSSSSIIAPSIQPLLLLLPSLLYKSFINLLLPFHPYFPFSIWFSVPPLSLPWCIFCISILAHCSQGIAAVSARVIISLTRSLACRLRKYGAAKDDLPTLYLAICLSPRRLAVLMKPASCLWLHASFCSSC